MQVKLIFIFSTWIKAMHLDLQATELKGVPTLFKIRLGDLCTSGANIWHIYSTMDKYFIALYMLLIEFQIMGL